jgi:hypothetical protein
MVPKGFGYKEIPYTCGMTGPTGNPEFCDECAPKYKDRDWKAEAEEAGERWDPLD